MKIALDKDPTLDINGQYGSFGPICGSRRVLALARKVNATSVHTWLYRR
jgi:hypothetical protein